MYFLFIPLVICILLGTSNAAVIEYKESVAGQTCFTQPVSFKTYNSYTYTLSIDQTSLQLGPGCNTSSILISPLYVQGTCLAPHDNNYQGCPSTAVNATTIQGTSSSAGQVDPITSTSSLCNMAMTRGSTYNFQTTSAVDTGSVNCGPSAAFFFVQNNCPAASGYSSFRINIAYTPTSLCPSGSSYASGTYTNNGYYYYHNPVTWPIYVGCLIGVFVIVFILTWLCLRRRRQQQAAQAIQMQQMMPPPQSNQSPMMYSTSQQPVVAGYPSTMTAGTPTFPSTTPGAYPTQPQYSTQYPGQYPPPEGGVNQPPIWHK